MQKITKQRRILETMFDVSDTFLPMGQKVLIKEYVFFYLCSYCALKEVFVFSILNQMNEIFL